MPDPAIVDLRLLQGTDWIKPFRVLASGVLIDTTLYTARAQVRASVESSAVLLDMTTANTLLSVGFDPPKRTNATAYGLGQQVVPSTLNGYVYQCTTAGTSHASVAPTWPTTIGGTVSDGTVTWTCVSSDAVVTNLRIVLAPATTTPLANWGLGFWDLELIDSFGHVLRAMEGNCVLSREITR